MEWGSRCSARCRTISPRAWQAERAVGEPDEGRRALASRYLSGRTLKEPLAAWRADYASPAFRERRGILARLGTVIRRLADEARERDEAAADHPGQRVKERPPRR